MTTLLKVFHEWIIVALDNKIVFLRPDGRVWSYKLDPALPLEKGRPGRHFSADSDIEDDKQSERKEQELQPLTLTKEIVSLDVNEAKSMLAVTTLDKSLYLFEIVISNNDERLNLLSRRLVLRTSSCIKFAMSGKFLIVCDKGGDCFEYDCEEFKTPGRWLFGHLSQVLDAVINADETLIITCDRDEKIRITSHPDCHNIEMFCLGHSEFVSQLSFTNSGYLISVSGDKTVRTWNHKNGQELTRFELELPGNKLALYEYDDFTLLAILCYEPRTIKLFKLIDDLQFEYVQDLKAKHSHLFSAMAFDRNCNFVVISLPIGDGSPSLATFSFDGHALNEITSIMQTNFDKQFKCSTLPYVDSVSFLFKKKFDNITNYHERKRKRIEENHKT